MAIILFQRTNEWKMHLENSLDALRKGYLIFNVDKRQQLILRNSFLKPPLLFSYILFFWFMLINTCSFNYQKARVHKEIYKGDHTSQAAQASSSVCLDLEKDYCPEPNKVGMRLLCCLKSSWRGNERDFTLHLF